MALIKCPECGHDVSDKAKLCPHCGYPIYNLSKCPECGTIVKKGARFCPKCGYSFVSQADEHSKEQKDMQQGTENPTVPASKSDRVETPNVIQTDNNKEPDDSKKDEETQPIETSKHDGTENVDNPPKSKRNFNKHIIFVAVPILIIVIIILIVGKNTGTSGTSIEQESSSSVEQDADASGTSLEQECDKNARKTAEEALSKLMEQKGYSDSDIDSAKLDFVCAFRNSDDTKYRVIYTSVLDDGNYGYARVMLDENFEADDSFANVFTRKYDYEEAQRNAETVCIKDEEDVWYNASLSGDELEQAREDAAELNLY